MMPNGGYYTGYYNETDFENNQTFPSVDRQITDLTASSYKTPTCYDDFNGGYPDASGYFCVTYHEHIDFCGRFDNEDFVSTSACCICGGGQFTPYDQILNE